jgi:ABC-type phosphate transport system substrate-binding protein
MKVNFKRTVARTALAVAALLALTGVVIPQAALAKKVTTQCSGVNVGGQGAATNAIAQNLWDTQFNSSSDKYACAGSQGTGGKPTVTYTNTGSGAGLESWGEFGKVVPNYGPTNAFIGTSEPFDSTAISEIESHETTPTPGTVDTIPVLQIADTLFVNLPTGCTATSTPAPGRLVLSQKTLEGIFNGSVTKWSQITDGGDALSGVGCTPTSTITPVVRFDQSGTAHYLKRYLGLINPGTLETPEGSLTWDQLSEGVHNTTWPTALAFVKPAKKGEAEEGAKIAATPGSIGFGNLAEERALGKFSKSGEGGAGTQKFWVEIESESKKGKAKYQDPATNLDVEAAASANCAKTVYTNGKVEFPPPAVTEPWNAVTTSLSQKAYPLCGFGFVLTTSKYSLFPGTSSGEAQSVHDLLSYATDKKGGQALLPGNDYAALPKSVAKEAAAGAQGVAF